MTAFHSTVWQEHPKNVPYVHAFESIMQHISAIKGSIRHRFRNGRAARFSRKFTKLCFKKGD